jgi:hypothetical protein
MNQNTVSKLTTGFAGAVALAGASEAYGNVVASTTVPANFTPTSNTSLYQPSWDIDGDGTADFQFVFYQKAGNSGLNWLSGAYGYGGAGVNCAVAYTGAYATYINRLTNGNTVGPASGFAQGAGTMGGYVSVLASRFGTKLYGAWKTVTDGFMGFEFTASDGLHYGYIEIKTSRFVSAANAFYETTPNTAITVAAAAVPEPGTLASLAFGAAMLGATAMRRARKA